MKYTNLYKLQLFHIKLIKISNITCPNCYIILFQYLIRAKTIPVIEEQCTVLLVLLPHFTFFGFCFCFVFFSVQMDYLCVCVHERIFFKLERIPL